jgi:VIT1/CCC1 family predicted Fe2+/Mn2+ transporter
MEEPPIFPPAPPESEQAPPPPRTSLGARLLNVFAIPGDVFTEVKSAPPSVGNWLLPALLWIVVSWVGVWLIFSQPAMQHQVIDALEKSVEKSVAKKHIPKEQADQMRQSIEKYGIIFTKVGGAAGVVGIAFASPFAWGLVLWLIGVQVFKGKFGYMKAVEVAGLASTISVLEAVLRVLLVFGLDSITASPSAALLVKDFDPQKPSHSMLAAATNIMTFWVLMVRAVGLAKLSGKPLMRTAVWVFGIWAAVTSVRIGFELAMQAAFR